MSFSNDPDLQERFQDFIPFQFPTALQIPSGPMCVERPLKYLKYII